MDYYKVLKLTKEASDDEIVKSYKCELLKYNPEIRGQVAGFNRVFESYYILSDHFRRINYNKFYDANQLDSTEFKTWKRNQFKKLKDSKDGSSYSVMNNIVSDFFGAAILEGITSAINSIID